MQTQNPHGCKRASRAATCADARREVGAGRYSLELSRHGYRSPVWTSSRRCSHHASIRKHVGAAQAKNFALHHRGSGLGPKTSLNVVQATQEPRKIGGSSGKKFTAEPSRQRIGCDGSLRGVVSPGCFWHAEFLCAYVTRFTHRSWQPSPRSPRRLPPRTTLLRRLRPPPNHRQSSPPRRNPQKSSPLPGRRLQNPPRPIHLLADRRPPNPRRGKPRHLLCRHSPAPR